MGCEGAAGRMINTLSILVSLVGVVFIVVRAVMLDKTLPWFSPPPEGFGKPRPGGPERR